MDHQEIRKIIDDSGMTHRFISRNLGMSEQRFYRLISGKTKWTVTDVSSFCHFFRLSPRQKNDIFLP